MNFIVVSPESRSGPLDRCAALQRGFYDRDE
jgi:hypothetical protein